MAKNYITDKNSFIVYKDWEDYLSRFSDEDAGRLFKALFAFACRGEDTVLDGALDMLFAVMKNTIERDGKKWESVCEARSHFKKTKAAKDAKATDNDTDNDNENVNDNVNVNENDTVPPWEGQSRRQSGGSRRNVGKNKKEDNEHSYDLDKLVEHAMKYTPTLKKEKEP